MSTIRSSDLTRGARRAAVAAALLLTASEAAWLVRDLAVVRHPVGLLGGEPGAATAVYDPLLAATGLAAARTARRGDGAGRAAVPGGRHRAAAPAGAVAAGPAAGRLGAPTGPGAGGHPAAPVGDFAPGAVLRTPPHWTALALLLLAAIAGTAALRRASWSRPAALTAGALLLGHGVAGLAAAVRSGTLAHLVAAPAPARLALVATVLLAVCGLGALCAAALPGVPDDAGGGRRPVAYGDGPDAARPRNAPPPPSAPPPGW
ncbi:hypothetical protein ACIQU6_28955 [Streptomyces sp. NPDC090442]|uniref:hypothetical protein n=1 Tax=Streptomyces sp. NPDC090442 TaxID=3365962 RepID=UPI00381F1670